MNLFTPAGYCIYGLSTAGAFLSGALPFAVLAGAAAFGAPSVLWLVSFYSIAVLWTLCYLVPLLFVASRAKLPLLMAFIGASVAVLYNAYAIYVTRANQNPVTIGHWAAPFWVWLCLPLTFNIFQVAMTAVRYRQLRYFEVTTWPQ
jgi:hypothetical protein